MTIDIINKNYKSFWSENYSLSRTTFKILPSQAVLISDNTLLHIAPLILLYIFCLFQLTYSKLQIEN